MVLARFTIWLSYDVTLYWEALTFSSSDLTLRYTCASTWAFRASLVMTICGWASTSISRISTLNILSAKGMIKCRPGSA